jgi:hypothetical protein
MNDLDALLRSVLAATDDDATAAALADWLADSPQYITEAVRRLARGGPGRTAYVCTSGEYSDYGVDAVFLSRDEADGFVADRTAAGLGTNGVEEWAVGRPADATVKTPVWRSTIDLLNGKIERAKACVLTAAAVAQRAEPSYWEPSKYDESLVRDGYCRRHHVVGSFVSPEHADKLAAEFRQEFLRLVGGVGTIQPGYPYGPSDQYVQRTRAYFDAHGPKAPRQYTRGLTASTATPADETDRAL